MALKDSDIIPQIKKGVSFRDAAAKAKVSVAEMERNYYRLEPVADPKLKITGTPKQVAKQIVDGRHGSGDEPGLRWERLAARSGKTVSEVKKIYEDATGKSHLESYTGRGRNFAGNGQVKSKANPKAKPAAGAAVRTKQPPAKTKTKARTRQARQQKAGRNPS